MNLRHEELGDAVYVGRANPRRGLAESIFANPYRVDVDGTRAEVIKKYRSWLLGRQELVLKLHELRLRRLACWCSPEPCHADVLVELVDADEVLDDLAAAGVACRFSRPARIASSVISSTARSPLFAKTWSRMFSR